MTYFKAVKKGTFAAERYKGHIDANVASKDNSSQSYHIDGHWFDFRIKLCAEFTSCFKEEVTSFSCDLIYNLKVGMLAVSRHSNLLAVSRQMASLYTQTITFHTVISIRLEYKKNEFDKPY